MSVFSQPSRQATPAFDDILRQAGAVFSTRAGQRVVTNYGSSAGELAVCVVAVGVVDRRELAQFEVEGPGAHVDRALATIAATVPGRVPSIPAAGGAVRASGAWLCRLSRTSALVVSEPSRAETIAAALEEQRRADIALSVSDRSDTHAAIEVLGPKTHDVLRTLGVFGTAGDPKRVAPFTASDAGGVRALWLLESDHSALALVPLSSAGDLWGAIETAGRPFGVSCVGADAAERYALLDRGLRALRACV